MKKYLSIPLHCLVTAVLLFAATFSLATENDTNIQATKEDQMSSKTKQEKAYFAGGCFWCVEDAFEKITGVLEVVSGYSGGHIDNPTYEQVCSGTTGHAEAVEITFDPDLVSYDTLLHTFWRIIDPTDAGGSFVDRGSQYRSAIFFTNDRQEKAALASLKIVQESGIFSRPIVTEISKFDSFFKAETYHQNYCSLNPLRYRAYRSGTGRDEFIETVWGQEKTKKNSTRYTRPNDKDLKKQLTSIQYKVTREEGTEPPFKNEFWNNKKAGIYVDIISGEPLFSSTNKFESGTGWPSFTKPIGAEAVTEKTDKSFFSTRTEIRSSQADSHLGHVFNDGPAPTGQRYCINSAAMEFVPVEKMKEQGYEQFLGLFQNKPHK